MKGSVMNINESGFTLIEVMITILVLTIGILGITALQVSSVGQDAYTWHMTDVTNAASDVIETLNGLPYDDTLLAVDKTHTPELGSDGIDNDFDGEIDNDDETGPLSVTWEVTEGQVIADTKNISVTAVYEGDSKTATISLTTIIAED